MPVHIDDQTASDDDYANGDNKMLMMLILFVDIFNYVI